MKKTVCSVYSGHPSDVGVAVAAAPSVATRHGYVHPAVIPASRRMLLVGSPASGKVSSLLSSVCQTTVEAVLVFSGRLYVLQNDKNSAIDRQQIARQLRTR